MCIKKILGWIGMRSKKSIKLDRKRIALGQKHERVYMKKLCNKYLEEVDNEAVPDVVDKKKHWILSSRITPSQLARICRALIKCLDRIDKSG